MIDLTCKCEWCNQDPSPGFTPPPANAEDGLCEFCRQRHLSVVVTFNVNEGTINYTDNLAEQKGES